MKAIISLRRRVAFATHQKLVLPCRLWLGVRKAKRRCPAVSAEDFSNVKRRTLSYVAHNHRPDRNFGAYAYQSGGPPLLYASCYAALILHLCGELDSLPPSRRMQWASYIQSHQTEEGLFVDAAIDCPQARDCDWWGWRHLTLHALMALSALGAEAVKPPAIPSRLGADGAIEAWLEQRDWRSRPADSSNEVQNLLSFMQYARDFQAQEHWRRVLIRAFDWLDAHQDPQSGLWGPRFDSPYWLSQGVQAGYHLWLLYFYDGRTILRPERVIDSCLRTQTRFGGFGVSPNSSACEDIDSIDPLVRFSTTLDYRRDHIRACLTRALPWVLSNANQDGGWVFRRHASFIYGHQLMSTLPDASSMFSTWFRLLSLAYLNAGLHTGGRPFALWRFLEAPGHQFWHTAN